MRHPKHNPDKGLPGLMDPALDPHQEQAKSVLPVKGQKGIERKLKIAKSGRKWFLLGAEGTWAGRRTVPTKWKAEVAREVIGKGGRVSDYFAKARAQGGPRVSGSSTVTGTVGGDWTRFRKLPRSIEVDFHDSDFGPREIPYWEAMDNVYAEAKEALVKAYELGLSYVIFTHGCSTSRPGQTTARSVIRGLIKSTTSTPYVIKSKSIQHDSVYVAAIRPNRNIPPLPDVPICPKCEFDNVEQKETAVWFRCPRCNHQFNWFSTKED